MDIRFRCQEHEISSFYFHALRLFNYNKNTCREERKKNENCSETPTWRRVDLSPFPVFWSWFDFFVWNLDRFYIIRWSVVLLIALDFTSLRHVWFLKSIELKAIFGINIEVLVLLSRNFVLWKKALSSLVSRKEMLGNVIKGKKVLNM